MAFSYEDIIDRARELRKQIEADAAVMDDNTALKNINRFPAWSGNKVMYRAGIRIRYQKKLYRVRFQHTSSPEATPDVDTTNYKEVLPEDQEVTDWSEVTIQNPVKKGGKVLFEGEVFESTINNNVWSPVENPDAWKKVEE